MTPINDDIEKAVCDYEHAESELRKAKDTLMSMIYDNSKEFLARGILSINWSALKQRRHLR